MDYLQEMLDLLKEKNTERKKQENLLNSQNVNFFNFDRNLKRFSEKDNWKFQKIFLLYLFKGSDFIASFFYAKYFSFLHNSSAYYKPYPKTYTQTPHLK